MKAQEKLTDIIESKNKFVRFSDIRGAFCVRKNNE